MPSYNPGIKITEQVMSLSSLTEKYGHSIRISTSPAIREKLLEKAERGISPSALNTFIQCSLRFYFHEIAGIRETEEVEETIENSTLGNVVHHALHLLFKESIGQTLSKEKIDRIKPNVRQALEIAFQEKYPDGETGYGKNLLITRVARIMLDQFLGQQTELLIALENSGKSQTLLHLEEFFDTQETIDFEGGQLTIKLKGKVDRIDQVGEQLHVIDYKTGAVKASELKIKDWESLVSDPRHGKAFQLLLYAYVFINSQDRKEATTVTGNISMRELSKGFQRVQLPGNSSIDQESLAVFRQQLLHLLETIWSPTTEFYQTEDTAQCIYCPFKGICGR
jgi:ATP-dependent helicase/DNAse subunit B